MIIAPFGYHVRSHAASMRSHQAFSRDSGRREAGGSVALHPGTGGGAGERHRRHRVNPLRGSFAGAAALAGDAVPPAAKRLAMAGSGVPAMDGPAGQGVADGAVGMLA